VSLTKTSLTFLLVTDWTYRYKCPFHGKVAMFSLHRTDRNLNLIISFIFHALFHHLKGTDTEGVEVGTNSDEPPKSKNVNCRGAAMNPFSKGEICSPNCFKKVKSPNPFLS
jgi:hypothetical protein